jgi:hypothetical protein
VRARIEELRPTIPQAFLDQIGKGKREFHGADVAGLNERAEEMGELLDQLTKLKSIESQLGPIAKRLLGETVGAGERTRQADNAAAAKKEADDLREKIASQVNAGELIGASDRASSLANLGPQMLRGIVGGFTPSALGDIKAQIAPILSTAQQQIAEAFAEQVQGPLENAIQGGLASTLRGAIATASPRLSGRRDHRRLQGGGEDDPRRPGRHPQADGRGVDQVRDPDERDRQGALQPVHVGPGGDRDRRGAHRAGVRARRRGAGPRRRRRIERGRLRAGRRVLPLRADRRESRPSPRPARAGSGEANALVAGQPVHFTIIGQNDPTVQRQILELMARANRRGSTSG